MQAVIFMIRKVESTSDVNRGPEPCQSGTALTFQVLGLAYTPVDGSVRAYAHAHDDHYLTRSTPQTYKHTSIYNYIYIYTYKTASCTSCIRGSLRLAPNYYNGIIILFYGVLLQVLKLCDLSSIRC